MGDERDRLLNINTKKTMEKIGQADLYPVMEQAQQMYGTQPYEIFAAINRESKFNPNAKSKISSASGLGQFTKDTAKQIGLDNPFNPVESVLGIGKYLSDLKKDIKDESPLAAQKAYMLGASGYRRALSGDKKVAGLADLPGLEKKFVNDINNLSSGNIDVNELLKTSKATPDSITGQMSYATNPRTNSYAGLSQITSPKKQVRLSNKKDLLVNASEIGGLGDIGNLEEEV